METKYTLVETDIIKNTVCIECFIERKTNYFFDGYGPLCSRKCYAKYLNVEPKSLPKNKNVGRISG